MRQNKNTIIKYKRIYKREIHSNNSCHSKIQVLIWEREANPIG